MRPVDKRADIWAFGVVVYEMLTGRHAFPGDTVTDVLSAVISHDPAWAALPSNVPAAIVTVLRPCLEKDHRARLRDIGEARVALAQVIAGTTDVGSRSIASPPSRGVRLLPWMIAGIAVAAAIGVWTTRPAADAPLRKLESPRRAAARGRSPGATEGRHETTKSRN